MDHLCGAGETASNCIQKLCTYALVSFSEWICRFSKRLKQLRSLHLSRRSFIKTLREHILKYFKDSVLVWHYCKLIFVFFSEMFNNYILGHNFSSYI